MSAAGSHIRNTGGHCRPGIRFGATAAWGGGSQCRNTGCHIRIVIDPPRRQRSRSRLPNNRAMHTTVQIKGMHCDACADRVTEALKRVPGVTGAHATLNPPEAHVESDGSLSIDALDRALRSAGAYSVASAAPADASQAPAPPETPSSLYPLILIVLFLAGVASLTAFARGRGTWNDWMLDFMAGFFVVFSFFKLLDLRGFADAYRSYDILARRWRPYGFVYPFLELALGVGYLVRWQLTITNAATLILMLVSSIGVLRAVLRKRRIRCACLGTVLNLPMTTVTLAEDLGMAAMAGAALLWPS